MSTKQRGRFRRRHRQFQARGRDAVHCPGSEPLQLQTTYFNSNLIHAVKKRPRPHHHPVSDGALLRPSSASACDDDDAGSQEQRAGALSGAQPPTGLRSSPTPRTPAVGGAGGRVCRDASLQPATQTMHHCNPNEYTPNQCRPRPPPTQPPPPPRSTLPNTPSPKPHLHRRGSVLKSVLVVQPRCKLKRRKLLGRCKLRVRQPRGPVHHRGLAEQGGEVGWGEGGP